MSVCNYLGLRIPLFMSMYCLVWAVRALGCLDLCVTRFLREIRRNFSLKHSPHTLHS